MSTTTWAPPSSSLPATGTGLVVWQAAYLPYGEAQVRINLVENNLRFPGQYFDAESGLHYNWNRYYDPDTGRYISADPIGLDGGMNLYAYVGGNPVNWMDRNGLEGFGLGFYLGGGAEFFYESRTYCENGKTYKAKILTICGGVGLGAGAGMGGKKPAQFKGKVKGGKNISLTSVSSRGEIPRTRHFGKHEVTTVFRSADVQIDSKGPSAGLNAGLYGVGTSYSYCSDTILSKKLMSTCCKD